MDTYNLVIGGLACMAAVGMIWNLAAIAIIEGRHRRAYYAMRRALQRAICETPAVHKDVTEILRAEITETKISQAMCEAIRTSQAPIPYRGEK